MEVWPRRGHSVPRLCLGEDRTVLDLPQALGQAPAGCRGAVEPERPMPARSALRADLAEQRG
eukprot:5624822-Alexandrium_andersonii.AAC.1